MGIPEIYCTECDEKISYKQASVTGALCQECNDKLINT